MASSGQFLTCPNIVAGIEKFDYYKKSEKEKKIMQVDGCTHCLDYLDKQSELGLLIDGLSTDRLLTDRLTELESI